MKDDIRDGARMYVPFAMIFAKIKAPTHAGNTPRSLRSLGALPAWAGALRIVAAALTN